MAAFDHWHPVLESKCLKKGRVLGIKLCDEEVALFRSASGALGAVCDQCPHRGARLSRGSVKGERLVCPYHAWSFAPDGHGQSPATPQITKACVKHYDIIERYGALWIKSAGSSAVLPELSWKGYKQLALLFHRIHAPLEILLDNFTEVEHTPTTHWMFGYAENQLASIETKVEVTETSVRVFNKGRQKPLPWFLAPMTRLAFGIKEGDTFVDDWTTYFSPVHTIYNHWWADPQESSKILERLYTAVFFIPINADTTKLVTFVFGRNDRRLPKWFRTFVVRVLVDKEVRLDKEMVESLADKRTDLGNRWLGRFDHALRDNRKRISRIYRER